MKDFQAIAQPFIPQNMKFLYFFYFCGSLLPSWIRIQPTKKNSDPDPQDCFFCFKDPVCLLQVVAAFLAGCTEAVLTPLERIQTLLLGQNIYKPLNCYIA
jgi:hypothetical protein